MGLGGLGGEWGVGGGECEGGAEGGPRCGRVRGAARAPGRARACEGLRGRARPAGAASAGAESGVTSARRPPGRCVVQRAQALRRRPPRRPGYQWGCACGAARCACAPGRAARAVLSLQNQRPPPCRARQSSKPPGPCQRPPQARAAAPSTLASGSGARCARPCAGSGGGRAVLSLQNQQRPPPCRARQSSKPPGPCHRPPPCRARQPSKAPGPCRRTPQARAAAPGTLANARERGRPRAPARRVGRPALRG
jgi:hypothetical protein